MKYHSPEPISRAAAEVIFAVGNPDEISETLVRAAFHDADWRWTQTHCLYFLKSKDARLREIAAICLGHIARIHQRLDLEEVKHALILLSTDPEIGGSAIDALDNIRIYLNNKGGDQVKPDRRLFVDKPLEITYPKPSDQKALAAELRLEGEQVAEINGDPSDAVIELYPLRSGKILTLKVDDFIQTMGKAVRGLRSEK